MLLDKIGEYIIDSYNIEKKIYLNCIDMFDCKLCEKSEEYLFTSSLCSKCRKVKHYLSLYGDRVYEVLDSVLSRDIEKQNNKIRAEIHEEINKKEDQLALDPVKTRSKTEKIK